MAVYKTRWFDRWARKEGLKSADLCLAVDEMTRGLIDADLGGGLVKIGAVIVRSASSVRVHLSSHHPCREVFLHACGVLSPPR